MIQKKNYTYKMRIVKTLFTHERISRLFFAGEGYKQVRVGQLSVPLGTLNMAVAYRTKMTITPTQTIGRDSTTLLLKSTDPHWNLKDLSPKHRYQNYGSSKKR